MCRRAHNHAIFKVAREDGDAGRRPGARIMIVECACEICDVDAAGELRGRLRRAMLTTSIVRGEGGRRGGVAVERDAAKLRRAQHWRVVGWWRRRSERNERVRAGRQSKRIGCVLRFDQQRRHAAQIASAAI